MVLNFKVSLVTLSVLCLSQNVAGRIRWLERDGHAIFLHPRRFGQEHPAVIDKLSSACGGGVCATLAGAAITPLLAAQGECTQQDMADQIIDTAAQFDNATQQLMISLAVEYRQAEKNTPPDFTTNPPTLRNSVFCQKAPKNPQLNGLVQAQDPANDPNVFFDPALGKSVQKGSQANTEPFGGAAASNDASAAATTASATATDAVLIADSTQDACSGAVTVTVTGDASASAPTSAATVSVGSGSAASGSSSSAIGNFGSCSVPQIEFGVGFDNRKETSFQPKDKTSFNHGSAQNIDIITQFICDTLTNSCGADQTAKDTCAKATTAADAQTAKTGAQADAFNAAFGITTNFANVAEVDDQGNVVAGTGSANNAGASNDGSNAASSSSSAATSASSAASSSSGIGNFGSCSVPQIEFGTGFDNRKETSFQPTDKASFNHGSAQNIDIISKFICDTLTNSCGADQTAKDTCAKAEAAADAQTAKTGAQADAFNAVFGIKTNFANVAEVDDQGNIVAGTGSANNAGANTASSSSKAAAPASSAASSSSGIGDFGSCSVPQIEFGTGFDNRKETSFQPTDKASFNHGSAQNIDIITQFICDTLTNSCKADQTAKDTCAKATAAADAQTAKTGAQADAFNAVFGIKTNFANVAEVDDQGNVVSA